MSKAVLVMDEMPENCLDCDYRDDHYCDLRVDDHWIPDDESMNPNDHRPDWCPLRELPERKETDNMVTIMHDAEAANRSTLQQIGYNRGWNDCLDEIIGGE